MKKALASNKSVMLHVNRRISGGCFVVYYNLKCLKKCYTFSYRNPSGPAIADREPVTLPLLREPVDLGVSKGQITLQFTDPVCQSRGVVGGKGAQLALLTQIQSQV